MRWAYFFAGLLTVLALGVGRAQAAETLIVGTPQAVVGLDPHGFRATDRPVQLAVAQAFDTLVVRNEDRFKGALATSWTTPDPQTWIFHLRLGVRFQDGTSFDATDVKASFDRVVRLNGPLAPLFNEIVVAQVRDPQTIIFRTRRPSGTLLSSLTLLFIGPAGRMDQVGFWQHPVGTGPFRVSHFASGQVTDFTANRQYWNGMPKVGAVSLRYYPEVVSRITALKTGEIDLTWNIPPDQIQEVAADRDLIYHTAESQEYYFAWFNSSRKPFNDVRVRKAMWYALDIPKIVKYVYGDLATVARGPIPQTTFGAPVLPPYPYDPVKARQLLVAAGYPNGFSATMQWNHQCCANIRVLAETMIAYWAKIGIRIAPLEKARAQWMSDFLALEWDIHLQTNASLTGDADYTLGRLYTCKAHRNGYCNPELDRLLSDAASTLAADRRRDLYRQAATLIWNDSVGIFPMDLRINAAWRKNVSGFAPPSDELPRFWQVSKS